MRFLPSTRPNCKKDTESEQIVPPTPLLLPLPPILILIHLKHKHTSLLLQREPRESTEREEEGGGRRLGKGGGVRQQQVEMEDGVQGKLALAHCPSVPSASPLLPLLPPLSFSAASVPHSPLPPRLSLSLSVGFPAGLLLLCALRGHTATAPRRKRRKPRIERGASLSQSGGEARLKQKDEEEKQEEEGLNAPSPQG